MVTKSTSARKVKGTAGTKAKAAQKKSVAKKSQPGMMARAVAAVTSTVKNIGARRAKRQAKLVHIVADGMSKRAAGAQKLAKLADARATRRAKAARKAR